jgi:hypothetical protein
MKKIFLLTLIAAAHVQAAPPSIEGMWEVTWLCEGPACPAGEDSFHLEVRTHGDQMCAKVLASAHGGNKVDEDEDGEPPSVVGRYSGGAATVAYTSHWGGHGVASIQVNGDSLSWKTLWHDDGESYIPSGAVLRKVSLEGRPLWRDFTCPRHDTEREAGEPR